jgi:hypothetical protein
MASGGEMDPAIQRLIEIGRAVQARDAAARAAAAAAAASAAGEAPRIELQPIISTPSAAAPLRTIVVQFATPDAAAFDGGLGAVRGVPGVRGLNVTSTAVGGTSVMSVSFAGSQEELAAALQARGYVVRQGQNALAISR